MAAEAYVYLTDGSERLSGVDGQRTTFHLGADWRIHGDPVRFKGDGVIAGFEVVYLGADGQRTYAADLDDLQVVRLRKGEEMVLTPRITLDPTTIPLLH